MMSLLTVGPIGFLGAGNMAGAIIDGMIRLGNVAPQNVIAYDVRTEPLQALKQKLSIQMTSDPMFLMDQAKVIVLAVKPQNASSALMSIASKVCSEHLLISIMAGRTIEWLSRQFPPKTRLIRTMPNTPALIGIGATAIARGEFATSQDMETALELFKAVGLAIEVEEARLDAITALSGSGPAYFFRILEIMANAGCELGLSAEISKTLALQTALGATQLALQSEDSLEALRIKVTSPNGTTAAALSVFESDGLEPLIKKAMQQAYKRSIELSKA